MKNSTILRKSILIVMLTLTCAIMYRCLSFMYDPYGFSDGDYKSEEIVTSYEEKLIKTKTGASIYVPVNAVPLTEDGEEGSLVFSIERSNDESIPELMEDEVMSETVYQFGPGNIVFAEPVKISLPVMEDIDENTEIQIYRINPETGTAELYPSVIDSATNEISAFTYELSRWACVFRQLKSQQNRQNYGYGMVRIINTMPVPVKATIVASILKNPEFDNNFKGGNFVYLPAHGEPRYGNNIIDWKLPQGKFQICFEWNDGHFMNRGTKVYYDLDNIELTRAWNPLLPPEKTINFHRVGELGSCGTRPTPTPLPPGGGHDDRFGTMTDPRDGKVYTTVKIGNQVWTVENLNATKYNDGTPIPKVTDDYAWSDLTTGAYCNYDNLESNANTYGRLYNWYAVNTGKLAPSGWHVPSDVDWIILENFLINNGYQYDVTLTGNYIAKSLCAKTNWEFSEEPGAPGAAPENNNRTGFRALPGGFRYNTGGFYDIGSNCKWWSATEHGSSGTGRYLYFSYSGLYPHNHYKEFGLSVRLVKD